MTEMDATEVKVGRPWRLRWRMAVAVLVVSVLQVAVVALGLYVIGVALHAWWSVIPEFGIWTVFGLSASLILVFAAFMALDRVMPMGGE